MKPLPNKALDLTKAVWFARALRALYLMPLQVNAERWADNAPKVFGRQEIAMAADGCDFARLQDSSVRPIWLLPGLRCAR